MYGIFLYICFKTTNMLKLALLFLLISPVLLFFLIKRLIKEVKKKIAENKKNPKITNKFNANISLSNFDTQNVKTTIYQLLESLELIRTSKNLDIVTGRYEFVLKISQNVIKFKGISLYQKLINETVEVYKLNYYDKEIFDFQIAYCYTPDAKDALDQFYIANLLRALEISSNIHKDAINAMKQRKAILKRYDKIIELIDYSILETQKFKFSSTYLSKLEDFRKQVVSDKVNT